MSEKDIKILIEIAEKRIREGVTAEEALADFVSAGIMDWNGNYTAPYRELLGIEE